MMIYNIKLLGGVRPYWDSLLKANNIDWEPVYSQRLPTPNTEITFEEYMELFESYYIMKYIGHTQLFMDEEKHRLWHIRMYAWDHQMLIYANYYDGREYIRKYFRIGCIHEYERKTIKMFQHKSTCIHCGFTTDIDSSG